MHRLTITLPDDLYAMARAYAVTHGKSISKAIGELIRQGRAGNPPPQPQSASAAEMVHHESGFPILEFRDEMTMEDVQRANEDDDSRYVLSEKPGRKNTKYPAAP